MAREGRTVRNCRGSDYAKTRGVHPCMFKGNPQESRLNGLQRILLDTLTPQIIGSLDDWWGGRAVTRMLPRLFFDDFSDTSFVVADAQADGDAHIVGFLCGYTSQSSPGEAHVHFAGVDPAHRGSGVGRLLYDTFFEAAKVRGCTLVHCVTSPINVNSIKFHRKIGFDVVPVTEVNSEHGASADITESDLEIGTVAPPAIVHVAWDGPGEDRVLFRRRL